MTEGSVLSDLGVDPMRHTQVYQQEKLFATGSRCTKEGNTLHCSEWLDE